MDEQEKRPLEDEARARADWRGEDEPPEIDAPGHTQPASEDQDERFGAGGEGSLRRPLGTILPPD